VRPDDVEALRQAKALLEQPRLAGRLAELVGTPIERSAEALPQAARQAVARATHEVIWRALWVSVRSLDDVPLPTSRRWHKAASLVSGALGGLFGLPSLLLELPLSTALMLRSIAAIAREYGEDLRRTEARLACLQVFALGGFGDTAGRNRAGYFATRAALAGAVTEAAQFLSERGLQEGSVPVLVRLVDAIAARFGLVLSDKLALGAVPLVGAVGGAITNAAFMDHFQKLAHGHFALRHLERRYDRMTVRAQYELL
jgi:hypothetical protein